MKHLFIFILSIFLLKDTAHAQNNSEDFYRKVAEAYGDLNKDNLADKVIVSQDTISANGNYRLQVFFKMPDDTYQLLLTAPHAIPPEYPDGRSGLKNDKYFSSIGIKNGVLTIKTDLIRGYFTHKFRFQGGKFELISFYATNTDESGISRTIDFNLLTGTKIEKLDRIDKKQSMSSTKKGLIIKPLPVLQNFIPLKTELY